MTYSPWGRPRITSPDELAPEVSSLEGAADGTLRVEFTEAVDPTVSASAPSLGLVPASGVTDLVDAFAVSDAAGTPLVVSSVEVVPEPGAAYGSVYRVVTTPALQDSSRYTVALAGGVVQDEWRNVNPSLVTSVTYRWRARKKRR